MRGANCFIAERRARCTSPPLPHYRNCIAHALLGHAVPADAPNAYAIRKPFELVIRKCEFDNISTYYLARHETGLNV